MSLILPQRGRIRQAAAGGTNYTVLMLNLNGTDGATTTTDTSDSAHTITFNGNAQLDTADKKFGSASLLCDGSGDYIVATGSLGDFDFGTGNFSIEFQMKWVSGAWSAFDFRQNGAGTGLLFYGNGAGTTFMFYDGANRITSGTGPVTNVWTHHLFQRVNGVTRYFKDGVQGGSDYADTNNYLGPANGPYMGAFSNGSSSPLNGWLDDIRVAKGFPNDAPTYTHTGFTPPVAEIGP